MASDSPHRGLLGRSGETTTLDRLLEAVRAGESRALAIRGDAGVGKTALLEYVVEHATGCRVARAAGVQAEMELAFAGLHQLCAPMLDGLRGLPGPQRDALRVAFALEDGDAPNPFLVALAVLSLLAEAAEARPVVCLVDDADLLVDDPGHHGGQQRSRVVLADPVDAQLRKAAEGVALAGLADGEHHRDPLRQQPPGDEPEPLGGRPVATGSSPRPAATRSR
jgi:AAA ATPase-like protein